MIILGIETSCDETSIAILKDGNSIKGTLKEFSDNQIIILSKELIKNPETRNCNSDELKIIKKLTPIIIKSKKENIVIN